MAKIIVKIKRILLNFLQKFITQTTIQELLGREIFFHNVFRMLSFNGIDGDYLEFGCCGGETFSMAYRQSRKYGFNCKLWAFDSFEGLPAHKSEDDIHPFWIEGEMKTSLDKFNKICRSRGIKKISYTTVKGFYSDSLPKISKKNIVKNISLVYIDCDLYSSTKDVLKFIKPKLKHGMVIALDDYFCYSKNNISGEKKSFEEFVKKLERKYIFVPYMKIGWHGMSFIVQKL